jgi:hypothetical protein
MLGCGLKAFLRIETLYEKLLFLLPIPTTNIYLYMNIFRYTLVRNTSM